jgi:hypothetical protein
VRTDPRFEAIPVRSTAAPVGSIRVIFPDLRGVPRGKAVPIADPLGDARNMDPPTNSIFARAVRAVQSLGPFDYAATLVLVAVYAVGTSLDEGPDTSLDFYRAVATVIPTLLITVAIQGRLFELSRKLTFRHQYRTVLFAVVVFGGEAGTLMTIAREKTNWAAHLYVYLAMLTLGLATLYLALSGTPEQEKDAVEKNERDGTGLTERRD